MTTRLNPDVEATVATWPKAAQTKFAEIRRRIRLEAAQTPEVGPLTETIKWGEPSWLTEATKSGTTIRVAWKPARADKIGVFVSCQTSIIETLREVYGDTLSYDGARGLLISLEAPVPENGLTHLIRLAQSYHINRKETAF